MMNDSNPFKAGSLDAEPKTEAAPDVPVSDSRAAYNTVSDLVGGLNVRKNDNRFQAKFIGVSVLLGAVLGVIAALFTDGDMPFYGGALLGSFGGLVIGFFGSGIFLMVYRAMRHMRGKHD